MNVPAARLSAGTLGSLASGARRFDYDRDAQLCGIVHFGIGAFHRAHQAWYTDRAMQSGERDWLITGVSLRSPAVAEQLNPQDGLYTLTERAPTEDRLQVIGAVRNVLVASAAPSQVVACVAAMDTRIVSLTVTEKGYCRAEDGSLDYSLATDASVYRFIATGLRHRREAGIGGLTLLSCDNLAANGRQLARLLGEYLQRHDPALLPWFEAECTCPSTMVDRIVPATTGDDLQATARALGVRDEGAVMTEPFSQWVIEDRFAGARPDWGAVGAELVADVAPYETAKLRMLNGAHSALAYLGLERGHVYVHQAIGDPALRQAARTVMLEYAAPSIDAAPGQDLDAYAQALMQRFANPKLNHRLAQIAMDGSQKIPQRWLATLEWHSRRGRACPVLLQALAAWLRHLRDGGSLVDDPLSDSIRALWQQTGNRGIVSALFSAGGLLGGHWQPQPAQVLQIESALYN